MRLLNGQSEKFVDQSFLILKICIIYEILLLNLTLFNNPEVEIEETFLWFFTEMDLICCILLIISFIIFEFSSIYRIFSCLFSLFNSNIFEITDNGVGIKKEAVENSASLGLIGIKERVHPWDGQVKFEGSPGTGTTVKVTIPLKIK